MSFRRLLVANRGEIAIRVFRAAHELSLRTIAIYTHEDRFALHRFKADEAYEIGKPGEPVRSYINIPDVIRVAIEQKVDAIHPGYGFLSENADFAQACVDAGIAFVGPRPEVLKQLGDKVTARGIARAAGVPIIEGSPDPLTEEVAARALASKIGYPVILKAAHGGGGRGMRVVRKDEDLIPNLEQAQREARQAFGREEVFLEKFIERARHIEVQLLGDKHGNLLHFFERECSIQRRHQKIAEIAPAPTLKEEVRQGLHAAALKIGKQVGLDNAGTVEFLVDEDTGKFYFIEVNPRIQVEHTVTEAVTGTDLVAAQIQVASGERLDGPVIGLKSQSQIRVNGFALQCRVTTEDPANDFTPDYGRILHYRSAGGMGIRLDAGNAFSGALVTPFFDSLLVKVTAWGHEFRAATLRMERALQEFRIRGVQTNIPFLLNLVADENFINGRFTTRFLDENPALFTPRRRRDRATKLLTYLAEITVNGHPQITHPPATVRRAPAPLPPIPSTRIPPGTRQMLDKLGPKGLAKWVLEQKKLLLTDTTLRDAHQSLLATRLRTNDMVKIADAYAHEHAGLFSLEMWGGATFDTAMRFLSESPWRRLRELRRRIPNILFQMLLRSSNAVGYTTYPDNVVKEFILVSAREGIDVFRIFDSLNWVENMRVAIDAVLETGKICEPAICYTGDILDPGRSKYGLGYYVSMAKELEKLGAHILAIKDMSGLCKPAAAAKLVKALKQEIGIPIHFHTHDTAATQAAAVWNAAEVGLDIADASFAPFSGLTSQPNLNSLIEVLRFTDRETGLDPDSFNRTADYWEIVREYYAPFESGMRAGTARVFESEIPGGQWTNLQQQAKSLGLGDQFARVCEVYAEVNRLFGDIVKVTPTSKVVGDMALFMVTNNYTPADVTDPNREMAFPESVVEMFEGRLGQPLGGWPKELQKKILRDRPAFTTRPGVELPPTDFAAATTVVGQLVGGEPERVDVLSYLLYPRVFTDWVTFQEKYSDPSVLPTPLFFYGLVPGEEEVVEIEPGKTLIVKLTAVGEPHPDGYREVFFELNGQPRDIKIFDKGSGVEAPKRQPADSSNPKHVGSPMPGLVSTVVVAAGDRVTKGQKLATIEAMKMETTLYAEKDGLLDQVLVGPNQQVQTGDLLFVYQ